MNEWIVIAVPALIVIAVVGATAMVVRLARASRRTRPGGGTRR